MDPLISFVLLLTTAITFASLFQKLSLSRIVGYIAGGVLIFTLVRNTGFSLNLQYSEPFEEIGLILFFFQVGTLLDILDIRKNFSLILSSELVALAIYWASASLLSLVLFSSELGKLILFLLLTNCSSASLITLFSMKHGINSETVKAVTLQASIEDLLQFTILSIILTLGKTSFSLYEVLMSSLKISAAAILIYFATSSILKRISSGGFVQKPTNKFLLALLTSLTVSLIAGGLGLPTFFGAFIAGISFKSSIDVSDIKEMLAGLWELGILFYFSSIGAQLVSVLLNGSWIPILAGGVIFGSLSIIIRSVALSVGGILSGIPLETAVQISFLISTLSENGIIFAGMLGSKGIIPPSFTGVAVIAIITSLLLQYPIAQRSQYLSLKVTKLIPSKMKERLSYISKYYHLSVDLALRVFSISSIFFASLLFISYAIEGIRYIILNMNLSSETITLALSAINATGIVAITILFIFALRSIYRIELRNEGLENKEEQLSKYGRGLGLLLSGIAVFIQLNILKDYIIIIGPNIMRPIDFVIFSIAFIAVLLTLIFGFKYRVSKNNQ